MKLNISKPKQKYIQISQKATSNTMFDDYDTLFKPDKKRLHGKHLVPKFKKYQPKFW